MPAEFTYDYAIVRVVPRVQRGEMINVGVILSCADLEFLGAGIEPDEARLLALDPAIDLEAVGRISQPFPRSAKAVRRRGRSASCRRAVGSAGSYHRAARLSRCLRSTPAGRAIRRPPSSG